MQEKQFRLKRLYQSYGKVYIPGIYNENELPLFLRGREDYTELIDIEPSVPIDIETPAPLAVEPPTDVLPELRNKLRKVKQSNKDDINESEG